MIRFDGPPWIEVGVLRQGPATDDPADSHTADEPAGSPERFVVHLVAYHPRRTAQEVPHVDASWPVAGARLGFRLPPGTPPRCYLAPDGVELPSSAEGGYLWIDLPDLPTHSVLVVEPNPRAPNLRRTP